MPKDLTQLDPAWAWAPYQPSADAPWNRRLAAHLYRRAGFGATAAELDEATKAGPAATLDQLCTPPTGKAVDDFQKTASTLADHAAGGGKPEQLGGYWLFRMLATPDPLLEKLTLFWHGHFATGLAKVMKPQLMLEQNDLLRTHARGKFADMVRGISRDPAMLIYLDSTTNRRIRPNENYAREVMELFCLGVGNYTEKDIKELARTFTGWEVLGDQFRFNPAQHDTGSKSFLGSSGDFDGDDAVRVVLDQPAAARFIARKLIRFFAFDEPTASDALVDPIAKTLRKNDFEIGPAVRQILASNLFFSEHAVGRKVRSPVELAVGLLRSLGANSNLLKLSQSTGELGQALFNPPNVKGWDGGRTWINSATLLGRANLVRQLLTAKETSYDKSGGGSLAAVADKAGATTPEKVVEWVLDLFVAVPVPAEAKDVLLRLAGGSDGGPSDRSKRIAETIHAAGTLPEFQLS